MTWAMMSLRASQLDEKSEKRRAQVREFLREELAQGRFTPQCDCWFKGFDKDFSRRAGAAGLLGITWPKQYGGQEGSPLERFVVTEEFLAAGAPVSAHWVSERQLGPSILRFGTSELKAKLLPRITRGELVIGAGYSEPDVGSDLASLRTRADRVDGGWIINGTKIWTTNGHLADYMFVLCRTSSSEENKRNGISLLITELPAKGVTIRPIPLLTGAHHFNETFLEDVFVPDSMVLGQPGEGWRIITSELVLERSGPERFMSTFPLLVELIRQLQARPDDIRARAAVSELIAKFTALRTMSIAIATALEEGRLPNVEAALVKDMGTRFESEVAERARVICPTFPSLRSEDPYSNLMAQAIMHSPSFTLRGGSNEVLRGIVARGLGMR